MEAVRTIGSLRSAGTQVVTLLAGRHRYIYCGFVGRGNLGDEAMFEVIRERLNLGDPLVTLPGVPTLPLRLTSILGRRSPSGMVLGGGTLIGRYGWLDRVEAAVGSGVARRIVAIGTGVEDPAWSSQPTLTDTDELERWATILRSRFDRVTVRGPRSAATLREYGVDARVVGDPALLLTAPHSSGHVNEGRIVINLGASGPIWGNQPDLNSHVRIAASDLIRRGFRLRLLAMWDRDRDLLEQLASKLPTNAVTLVAPRNSSELVHELSSAQAVIGQRLHSVVMAAVASTPSISLAYRPKCLDFQDSIDRTRFTLRTDELDAAKLVDLTLEIVDNRDAETRSLRQNVNRLRASLTAEIAACHDLFVSV